MPFCTSALRLHVQFPKLATGGLFPFPSNKISSLVENPQGDLLKIGPYVIFHLHAQPYMDDAAGVFHC